MIALIDCNNFFVSCERSVHPELRDRPVVVLSNNDGCAVAMSNEAKALGITRSMPYFKFRILAERHNVAIISGNHDLYRDISRRVMSTVRDMLPSIEIYSIDEAFALVRDDIGELHEYGQYVADEIRQKTLIPVSIGIAPTKTLAKIAAHFAKKYPAYRGACVIDTPEKAQKALALTAVADVWGIGRRHARKLNDRGITTALQFAELPATTVRALFPVNGERTWRELNGEACIEHERGDARQTITVSRSFACDIRDIAQLREAVSYFADIAGRKLRAQHGYALGLSVFVATNRFHAGEPQYSDSASATIDEATDDTITLAETAQKLLSRIYRPGTGIKQAGVTITRIVGENGRQPTLFADHEAMARRSRLMKAVDAINNAAQSPAARVRLASTGAGIADKTRRNHDSSEQQQSSSSAM